MRKKIIKLRFQLIMFRRRLQALRLLLSHKHFLIITCKPTQAKVLLPDGFVHAMPTEMVIQTTGIVHEHTRAAQSIERQTDDILQRAQEVTRRIKGK